MLRRPSAGRFLYPVASRNLGRTTADTRDVSVRARSSLGMAAEGYPVLAGPVVPMVNPDSRWKPDLIWNYLGANSKKTRRSFRFAWRYEFWLKGMSRKARGEGKPYWNHEKRRDVYNLLVNSSEDTNCGYGTSGNSRIPWNQTHTTWMDTVERKLGLSCGTITWCFLSKYMDWPKKGFKELNLRKAGKLDGDLVDEGFKRIVHQLKKNLPVRVKLKHKSDFGGRAQHYVGIVGCNEGQKALLHIEPYLGLAGTMKYAKKPTCALGVIKYEPKKKMFCENGGADPYLIVGVEAAPDP